MASFKDDPMVVGVAAILRRVHASYREIVTGLNDEAVNWKPGEDTNSLYQMVHHALDVERMWITTAHNAPVAGRPEPWNLVGPYDDLLPRLDQAERDIVTYLEREDGPALTDINTFSQNRESQTVAVSLLRAVRHLSEHLGHIGLTRQMWEQHRDVIDAKRNAAVK